MNYFIYIFFTRFHCTGRNEFNKLTLLPMCGFIAQLVEHRIGIAEVMGSNPAEALIFFRLLLSNCLNWKIYCDDRPYSKPFMGKQISSRFLLLLSGFYVNLDLFEVYGKQPEMACFSDLIFSMPMFYIGKS